MVQNGYPKDERKYKGIWDCIKKIYQEEGFYGFFKGIEMTVLEHV